MPRLIHYSDKPLTAVRSRKHDESRAGAYKTVGLWVSVEGEYDWLWWSRAESWGLERFTHATEIILTEDANILTIDTVEGIDAFTKEYCHPLHPTTTIKVIDWDAVRRKYQGVIIAPYQWDRRLDMNTHWYYGRDCASGVIWDAKAICKLVPIEPPDMSKKEEAA